MDAILDAAIGQLMSADARERMHAARTLPLLAMPIGGCEAAPDRSPRIVDALLAATTDADAAARQAVVESLAGIGDWDGRAAVVIARLAELLTDAAADVRRAAVVALVGRSDLEEPPWRTIIAAAADGDAQVRCAAVEAIADAPASLKAVAYAAALHATGDADAQVRAAALETLDRLDHGAADTVRTLRQALHDSAAEVRQIAVRLLPAHRQDTPDVIAMLELALRDADAPVRRLAAVGLGDIGPDASPCVNALAERLDDAEPMVRRAAISAIEEIVRPRQAWIREALQIHHMKVVAGRTDDHTNSAAIRRLLSGTAEQAAAWFTPLLLDDNEQVRWYAALGVGESAATPVQCKDELVRMLRDGATHMKVAALVGMMGLGPEGAAVLDEIKPYVEDANYIVSQLAVAAMGVLRA